MWCVLLSDAGWWGCLCRQCKMYKRRADLLHPLLSRLNPTYYLMVIRQLQYELGEIYSDIAQCKVEVISLRLSNGASLLMKHLPRRAVGVVCLNPALRVLE